MSPRLIHTMITSIALMVSILFWPVYGFASYGDAATAQIQFAAVTVNGRTLAGPNSNAQRLNGRILVPVTAIARALGDVLNLDPVSRSVSVRRSTGILAEFDSRVGQIRENGSSVLSVSNAGEIIFPPNADELLLPVEIAASLFDVSIRYESDKNLVVIVRGFAIGSPVQTKVGRSAVEVHQIEYEYNLNRYSSATAHNLVLVGAGRLADGRFSFTSNTSRTSHGFSLQSASVNLERPNGQHFAVGDFGTGGNLQFLAANVRGVSASVPVGDLMVTAFGGRTFSGVISPFADHFRGVRRLSKYDTNVFGSFVTTNSPLANRRSFGFTGGAMRFSSANRDGTFATANGSYDSSGFRLQGDVGYGDFNGHDIAGRRISGAGAAVDLAGTFQLRDNLAVQARYTKIGRNFLSPQSGVREALDLKAAGITWAPAKWLSTSISASMSRRPGDVSQNNKFTAAAFAITPSGGLPRFYFSHTQSSTGQIRSASFTTLNASKEFSRLRLYVNATRIKNIGVASVNAQFGASFTVNDKNALEISQGLGNRGSYNGQFDWRTSNLFKQRLSLSAGAGYNYARSSGFSTYQRLAASVNLPRQTSLQLNYYNTSQGATVLVSVRGSVFKKREAAVFFDSPVSDMNSYGKVSGRVYQDTNLNGQFDPGIDQPQAEVKVRVDGNRYVVSDQNGMYEFESMTAGDHRVYLDLLSVRADLTLLSEAAWETRLLSGHESKYDFRLVRTGRISGRVWLDANENGKFDAGERPLADIRVVTASGRDTLTDMDGNFTIGDLAPGEHTFLIDEKTLPDKVVPARQQVAVQAFPGRETKDIDFAVVPTPAEIKRFTSTQN